MEIGIDLRVQASHPYSENVKFIFASTLCQVFDDSDVKCNLLFLFFDNIILE